MNFYERFVGLCNKMGKTPTRVVLEIGLSRPTVNRWKHGSNPTDATAMKVAEYFGVSIQELMGEADLGDLLYEAARDHGVIETPFKKQDLYDGLSESKKKLIELVKAMPESQSSLLILLVEQQIKDFGK